jgi:hypothetical protein
MGLLPFQPLVDDYPNRLAAPQPERLQVALAPWMPLVLLLLCLIPRAAMSLRITSICPDGMIYVTAAKALEAGNWKSASGEMSLNIYPAILTVLHRLGLDWELAASLWGVTVSSLVVLPLWGWVRRQFDDRVALAACFLYIIHPKFIEWSPEVLRDPTFWFFFTLAIYWLWRAVTEVHYGYFIAGGAAVILASLTRVEGLFLLIPLTLWTFWRYRSLQTNRKKLIIGVVLCIVVLPSLLALANLIFLFERAGWGALRLNPFGRGFVWLGSLMGRTPATSMTGIPNEPLTLGQMLWKFFPAMTRGLSPVYALLMFGGIWRWRRVWVRRDHQPLFYVALVVMCGIWVQLWYDRTVCPRYALPIVLMASPFAALGLLWLINRILWVAGRLHCSDRVRNATVVTIVAIIAAGNLTDAVLGNANWLQSRRIATDLGRWVHARHSTPPKIAGPVGLTPIVCFYSQSPYRAFRCDASDAFILGMIQKSDASLVLLQAANPLTEDRCTEIEARLKEVGYVTVDRSDLPPTCSGVHILTPSNKNQPVDKVKP